MVTVRRSFALSPHIATHLLYVSALQIRFASPRLWLLHVGFGFSSLCLSRSVTLSRPSVLVVLSICPYNARFRNTQKCPEYVQVSALSFQSTWFLAGTRLIHSAIGAFGWVRVGRFSRLRFAGTGKTGSPNWSESGPVVTRHCGNLDQVRRELSRLYGSEA